MKELTLKEGSSWLSNVMSASEQPSVRKGPI